MNVTTWFQSLLDMMLVNVLGLFKEEPETYMQHQAGIFYYLDQVQILDLASPVSIKCQLMMRLNSDRWEHEKMCRSTMSMIR